MEGSTKERWTWRRRGSRASGGTRRSLTPTTSLRCSFPSCTTLRITAGTQVGRSPRRGATRPTLRFAGSVAASRSVVSRQRYHMNSSWEQPSWIRERAKFKRLRFDLLGSQMAASIRYFSLFPLSSVLLPLSSFLKCEYDPNFWNICFRGNSQLELTSLHKTNFLLPVITWYSKLIYFKELFSSPYGPLS